MNGVYVQLSHLGKGLLLTSGLSSVKGYFVGDLLLLMAVRVNDSLELEVTDPKEDE